MTTLPSPPRGSYYGLQPRTVQRLLTLYVALCVTLLAVAPHVDRVIAVAIAITAWGIHGWIMTHPREGRR